MSTMMAAVLPGRGQAGAGGGSGPQGGAARRCAPGGRGRGHLRHRPAHPACAAGAAGQPGHRAGPRVHRPRRSGGGRRGRLRARRPGCRRPKRHLRDAAATAGGGSPTCARRRRPWVSTWTGAWPGTTLPPRPRCTGSPTVCRLIGRCWRSCWRCVTHGVDRPPAPARRQRRRAGGWAHRAPLHPATVGGGRCPAAGGRARHDTPPAGPRQRRPPRRRPHKGGPGGGRPPGDGHRGRPGGRRCGYAAGTRRLPLLRRGGTALVFGQNENSSVGFLGLDVSRYELTIVGSHIAPFCFPRAISLLEQGTVDSEKAGQPPDGPGPGPRRARPPPGGRGGQGGHRP